MSLHEELQTISGVGDKTAKQIVEIVEKHSEDADMATVRQAYEMLERGNSRAAQSALASLIDD